MGGAVLSAENKRQLWIPEGFAHGFMALSETVQFVYKATNYYAPQSERSIIWNDPEIGIDWPELATVRCLCRRKICRLILWPLQKYK
jgi:dTDP-4-dehydrorhamnose 3,5-epimerase